jgi:hypothetical protein
MRKTIAAIIAASTLAGCQVHAQENGGPTVSKNYQVGNFQQIEVAGPYDVEVRTGGNPSVAAKGSEKLLDRTTVEVKGDRLVIRPEHSGGFFHFGWSGHGKASFVVTVPQLTGGTIAGSGDLRIDKVQGDHFDGNVAGSGGITIGNLDVQTLKLAIAGSGGVKGAGKAKSAVYDIAGSGGIDGAGILAEQAKVSIAGSGDVKAHATGTADVSIMGSGDVNLTGGAKCNISKMGSGDVSCS